MLCAGDRGTVSLLADLGLGVVEMLNAGATLDLGMELACGAGHCSVPSAERKSDASAICAAAAVCNTQACTLLIKTAERPSGIPLATSNSLFVEVLQSSPVPLSSTGNVFGKVTPWLTREGMALALQFWPQIVHMSPKHR